MLKNKRLLLVTLFLILAAVVVLGMKIAYPAHRLVALILLGFGWIPLIVSYRINRRLLSIQKKIVKKKTRPYLPHAIVASGLLVAFYVTWALFPVEKSPLVDRAPETLRYEIQSDLNSYLMLCKAADDIVNAFKENKLLTHKVESLTEKERKTIRSLWRDGTMAFLEFDLIKDQYRGFHQVDYVAQPQLHADAFMLAYMASIAQYGACIQIFGMVDDNPFMQTLLNEAGEGIPADSCYIMKQRLTHPNVILRLNAAAAYLELVNKDITIGAEILTDFEVRRKSYLQSLEANANIFVDNPLAVLERAAFETMLPVQKKVAVQMSYIRTAKRNYLITPDILAEHRHKLKPADIMFQRRNWHMTNIGIPGFWPHTALYVGTPEEIKNFFSELDFDPILKIKTLYPDVYRAIHEKGDDGLQVCVIESIRPGVVFQTLETSARCDYLGVVRPNMTKEEKFNALLCAFSHYNKPYDLNFDFSTDNALVCSELIYKAFMESGALSFEAEIINGRLLLPPNRMAEQTVAHLGVADATFSFVLFLDALEQSNAVIEQSMDAFKTSWSRPKWDILQK